LEWRGGLRDDAADPEILPRRIRRRRSEFDAGPAPRNLGPAKSTTA